MELQAESSIRTFYILFSEDDEDEQAAGALFSPSTMLSMDHWLVSLLRWPKPRQPDQERQKGSTVVRTTVALSIIDLGQRCHCYVTGTSAASPFHHV